MLKKCKIRLINLQGKQSEVLHHNNKGDMFNEWGDCLKVMYSLLWQPDEMHQNVSDSAQQVMIQQWRPFGGQESSSEL